VDKLTETERSSYKGVKVGGGLIFYGYGVSGLKLQESFQKM
jgi:hypothetical protein